MLGLGNSITGGAALGFTPADLGSTLLAWYQFDTGQTNLSGTDGNADNEMKWEDQSGGSRHATQRTNSVKPTFTAGYVDFEEDTASDRLAIATGDGAIRLMDSGSDACTIIMAVRRESSSTEGRILGSSNSEVFGFMANTTQILTKSSAGSTTNEFASGTFPTGADFVLTYTRDSSREQLFYKNNALLSFATEANPLPDGEVDIEFLGGYKSSHNVKAFDGRIYEMIICDTVLSTANRQATTSYVMGKVGL